MSACSEKGDFILNTRIKDTLADRIMYAVTNTFMILILIVIIYPLIYVVSSSFSSGRAVSAGRVLLWPVEPSLQGYKVVFSYRTVWTGYANTIFYTFVGTIINLVMTTMAAYPLSRRNFQGKKFFTTLFVFTMFFGGGLIPTYILFVKLGLTDTRLAIFADSGISVYNMIIMRTFFQNSIPEELHEAAFIDGASDFKYMFSVLIPLSKAIYAVIGLYYAVGYWNSYWSGMIYLRNRDLFPLQLILRDILNAAKIDLTEVQDPTLLELMAGQVDLIKYALIIVSSVPILVAYPFVQKFFEKGVMIGSVKG